MSLQNHTTPTHSHMGDVRERANSSVLSLNLSQISLCVCIQLEEWDIPCMCAPPPLALHSWSMETYSSMSGSESSL